MDRSYWRTVSLVTLWQVSASVCYYAVFAATTFFRDEFGLSRLQVGLVVTTLAFGYALFLLPVGAVTDRVGERRTLSVGLAGLAAATVLVAGAPSYALLLIAVFLLGSVYSTAMPGTNKAVYDSIPPGRQNTAMGIKQVGVTGGSGVSALLVTGLAGYLFWEAGFLIAAGLALVVAAAFAVLYRGGGGGSTSPPDLRGLAHNRPYVLLVVAGLFLGAVLFTTTGYTVLYVEEFVALRSRSRVVSLPSSSCLAARDGCSAGGSPTGSPATRRPVSAEYYSSRRPRARRCFSPSAAPRRRPRPRSDSPCLGSSRWVSPVSTTRVWRRWSRQTRWGARPRAVRSR